MGLGQSQQVSLGWQDLPEAVAERRAKVASLAGLLGDDQNRHRRQPDPNLLVCQSWDGKYPDFDFAIPAGGDCLRPCGRVISVGTTLSETLQRLDGMNSLQFFSR